MALLTRADLQRHSNLTWVCLAALLGVAILLALIGRGGAALGTLGAMVGCLGLVLPPRDRMPALPARLRALPRQCDAAPVLATLMSVPGYGLGWFYGDNLYDEAVHLLNGALAGAVLAVWLLVDGRPRGLRTLATTGLVAGLALALGWEVFEWATGLIGGLVDTITDILLTTGGVVLGAVFMSQRHAGAAMSRELR